ncbi:NAD(+) synthase [Nitrosophilus alvini]|uniref:NAD(+) synthase n=1 Tax=Nitrosophilus alvini TaxID=2714855 RepID=UPI00190CF05D|nr:NAD(+) synthase [Nitrosophilus alvini]
MYGFVRVAAVSPKVYIAQPQKNGEEILKVLNKTAENDTAIALFPELCISGYTCADLFFQDNLLKSVYRTLEDILESSVSLETVFIVGAPLWHKNRLYNCAVVCQKGDFLGVVPKSYIPNKKEFYEKRWFVEGKGIRDEEIEINGKKVPFGTDLLFRTYDFDFGVEVCEDLWTVIPPSLYQAASGALLFFNLSASNDLVAKYEYRRELVKTQSARCIGGYIYASAGVHESTTDVVYGGHCIIAENGAVLAENRRFEREGAVVYADIDVERLKFTRVSETSFADSETKSFRIVKTYKTKTLKNIDRFFDPHPFVPSNPAKRDERCEEIFAIQAAGLAKRVEHTGVKKVVLGLSGGLDSTLALLVCSECMNILGRSQKDILAVTMPGFGTTSRTHENAKSLAESLGVELREIDITKACMQHFEDIGHNPQVHDVTYENTQARERTQILMDLANKEGGLVVGTGDLSEIALGFSTYAGDHISMYNVNSGVPKTLVRYLIHWVASKSDEKTSKILEDIISTPVSPELMPKGENEEIVQKTEDIIGPYELHDFFLYHMVKYGANPKKILYLAVRAFDGIYDKETIKSWLRLFVKRFFANQFKRSCMPDGPKVGTIALSPRGDWRMPSDAKADEWLRELE